ncbi:Sedoheptulose 1,7-bisphosphatase [Friedmanniomyces endolithicus]|nr:Sedoheptulose 1,7-bisphosphatase [Friedmanniomyces endolithicus]
MVLERLENNPKPIPIKTDQHADSQSISTPGRHTGTSDIPLTPNGEKRILATGRALVGEGRLIIPRNLAHIYVSPRKRAQRTLELLGLGCKPGGIPWQAHGELAATNCGEKTTTTTTGGTEAGHAEGTEAVVEVAEAVREWDYGEYEGVTSKEIGERRREAGEGQWDIWRDGCPGGESPAQITARLDALIADIRSRFHSHAIGKPKGSVKKPYDVLVVAHGHILRAFAGRWFAKNIADNPSLILDAGGVGTLSYEHHSLDEPAIVLGGAFMSDVVESAKEEREKDGEGRARS